VDCFQKIKQQVKCYIQQAQILGRNELQEALEIVESTNLKYFSKEMTAEFFTLKGLLLTQIGEDVFHFYKFVTDKSGFTLTFIRLQVDRMRPIKPSQLRANCTNPSTNHGAFGEITSKTCSRATRGIWVLVLPPSLHLCKPVDIRMRRKPGNILQRYESDFLNTYLLHEYLFKILIIISDFVASHVR